MTIDWLSQSLAALSSLVIGFFWYGLAFNKPWQESSGLSEKQIKNGYSPIVLYGASLVLAFVCTIGLKFLIVDIHRAFDSTTEYPFFHGMRHGLIISFIFGAIPVLVTNALFDQKNWKYILINVGYWLITFGVMGGIIGAMNG